MQEEEHATVPAQKQRIAALATGGVLALGGVRRRGILGISSVILGGNLVYEGLKGNSPLFRALGINHGVRGAAAVVPHGQSKRTEATVTIARPEDELFAWWRQLDHLPAIMDHIQSVHVVDERTSHWEMSLPAGKLEWDAEVYNEIRDELIAWRALPNSPINHAGTVRFGEAPGGRGTIVNLSISYAPPLGKLGATSPDNWR